MTGLVSTSRAMRSTCARAPSALSPSASAEGARAQVERIAREVLTNRVTEEHTYRIEEWIPGSLNGIPLGGVSLPRGEGGAFCDLFSC